MKEVKSKAFRNGVVYLLETDDGYPVEVTDTFLPFYTKDAIGKKQNILTSHDLGDRSERWLIGVSCMSGCPVGCKFCATGKLKKWRNLTSDEICEQVQFVLSKHNTSPAKSKEFKINYTRMGEPFLNINNVRKAIENINILNPDTHHYMSTIGIRGSDFGWIKGNVTLQVSLHSLDKDRRDWLIPYKKKMSIEDLGLILTGSNLKTTLNLTLVDDSDFDISAMMDYFNPKYFFVKLSPINQNDISDKNLLGAGIVKSINLI
jgi:23S rRNA (adenine2503-C2)-methyltransferase